METELIIEQLEKISKELFNQKKYYESGRINLAIEVLKELK